MMTNLQISTYIKENFTFSTFLSVKQNAVLTKNEQDVLNFVYEDPQFSEADIVGISVKHIGTNKNFIIKYDSLEDFLETFQRIVFEATTNRKEEEVLEILRLMESDVRILEMIDEEKTLEMIEEENF